MIRAQEAAEIARRAAAAQRAVTAELDGDEYGLDEDVKADSPNVPSYDRNFLLRVLNLAQDAGTSPGSEGVVSRATAYMKWIKENA